MIKKYHIYHPVSFVHFFFIISVPALLLSAGCAVSPREPCVKNGYKYGLTDDWAPYYDWDSCYRSGISYSQGECWEQAISQFILAIQKKPNDRWMARRYGMHFLDYFPHRELGIVYLRQGRIQEAIDELILSLSTADTDKAKYYLNNARAKWLEKTGLDQTPPQIEFPDLMFSANKTKFTNNDLYLIEGKATDDYYVFRILINDQPLFLNLAQPQISFQKKVHLKPGNNLFICKANDLVGHEYITKIQIFLDKYGPLVVFSAGYNDDLSKDQLNAIQTINLKGLIYDDGGLESVTIAKKPIHLTPGEKMKEFEVNIPLGSQAATFYAKDLAGNVTEGDLYSLWDGESKFGFNDMRHSHPYTNPSEKIRLCYNGQTAPLLISKNKHVAASTPVILINYYSPIVYTPVVTITGCIESTGEITDVLINDKSILPGDGIPFLRRMIYGRRTRFYFTRILDLKKGENEITLRAEGRDGLSNLKTIRVERQLRDIEKIGNRWQLAILPFYTQRLKYSILLDPPPCSMESLFYSLHNSFLETKRFSLLERERIDALMRELGLQIDNIEGMPEGSELGKHLKAEVSLFGSIHENREGPDRCLEIIARLVDVDTTEVLAMHNVFNRWKTREDVKYLLEGLAQKFIEDFPLLQGEIVDINRQTFEINLNKDDLIKKGMKVLVYRENRQNQAGQKKEENSGSDGIIGEGKVKKVAKNCSFALPIPNEILKIIRVRDYVITK